MKKTLLGLLTLGLLATSLSACVGSANAKLKIIHFDQTILGDAQKDLGVSIGIRKGDTELESALNAALATITDETRTKWMLEATDRAGRDFTTTTTTPSTVPTDPSLPVLKVGLECDYQPFNWTEVKANDYTYPIKSSNQYADGYDIQMARYLAATMNYRLEIYKISWAGLIPALQAGTINAVVAGMTDTEERRESIDFTNEYYRSELVLVVREDSQYANATSLEDFRGAKIVSQVETVTNDVIETWVDQFGVIQLAPLADFGVCAIAVKSGTADAMTAEFPVANAIVNNSK